MAPDDAQWRLAKLGEFLAESRVSGSTGATAKKLTVRLYGKGVVGNEQPNSGSEATRYFRRRAGQFIYSKLDFLNGAFGLVPADLDGYESTADMPAFDMRDGVHPRWLLAYVARPAFYTRLKGSAVGSRKARRVNPNEFLACRITAPPLEEQRGIIAALDLVDGQIAATERIIGLLRTQKRAVMARMLVGDHGTSRAMKPLNDRWAFGRVAPGIEHVPANWELVRLTSVAKLESGHTPSRQHPEYWEGDIPWLSMSDGFRLAALSVGDSTERVAELGIANSSARVLPQGTVIMIRTGGSRGACSRLGRPMATSQDYVAYVCGPRLEPRYLQQVFRSLGREWARVSDGSTTLRSMFMPVFRKLQVLLPPLAEQRQIADVGEAFDLRVTVERAHVDALRELKRGVADALLSGRVRLPPHVAASVAEGLPDVRE